MDKSVLGLLRQVRDKQKLEREELRSFVTWWEKIEAPTLKDILDFTQYIRKELGIKIQYTEAHGFKEKKSLKTLKSLVW
jgi:hypothetical protein